jgi:hypothetical protein
MATFARYQITPRRSLNVLPAVRKVSHKATRQMVSEIAAEVSCCQGEEVFFKLPNGMVLGKLGGQVTDLWGDMNSTLSPIRKRAGSSPAKIVSSGATMRVGGAAKWSLTRQMKLSPAKWSLAGMSSPASTASLSSFASCASDCSTRTWLSFEEHGSECSRNVRLGRVADARGCALSRAKPAAVPPLRKSSLP